ncbi:MAG: hypothetical protein ACR2OX_04405, partial [Methyloligellaceae bacterium]
HTDDPLTLFPTQERIFMSWVTVPLAVAIEHGCEIGNKAEIVVPAAPHPMNTIGGDDFSIAVATIPPEICPTVELKSKAINNQCPAGFDLTEDGCEKRKGPGIVTLPPKPGPQCWDGWTEYPSRSAIPSNYRKKSRTKNGETIWCGKRRTDTAGPTCPSTHKTYYSQYDVPQGYTWYKKTRNGKSVWCAKKKQIVLPGPVCSRGWTTHTSNPHLSSKKYVVQRKRRNGITIWCSKKKQIVLPGPVCSSGWRTHTSRPHLSSNKYSVQRKRRNGITIWCSKKKIVLIPCGPGYIGFKPACIKIKKCKSWQTGKWPNCRRKPCPRGYSGKQPNCKKDQGHNGSTQSVPSQTKKKKKINLKKFKIPKIKLN